MIFMALDNLTLVRGMEGSKNQQRLMHRNGESAYNDQSRPRNQGRLIFGIIGSLTIMYAFYKQAKQMQ